MAHPGNTNIIPFDDVKHMASSRNVRSASVRRNGRADAAVGEAMPSAREDGRSSARYAASGGYGVSARTGVSSSYGASSSSFSSRVSTGRSTDIHLAGSARPSVRNARSNSTFSYIPGSSSRTRFDEAVREEPADDIFAPRAALEAYEEESGERSKRSSSDRRKARAKQRAEKMFTRQFGADDRDRQETSRAAVYKAEMGKSHKRAFENLGGSTSSRKRSSASSEGKKASRIVTPRLAIVLGSLLCIVMALVFLYPTTRQYYLELREQSRLQAEYDALSARNAAMESEIEHLKTDEGIKDAARTELGWVEEGETAGVVQGLDQEASSQKDESINAQVKSGSVPAPETWYSPMLDAFFGYVDPASAKTDNTDMSNVHDVASDEGASASSDGEGSSGEVSSEEKSDL